MVAAVAAAPGPRKKILNDAARGLAALEFTQRKTTSSIPQRGESLTLALTPKKKRRYGRHFVTDNMPSLNLNGNRPSLAFTSLNSQAGFEDLHLSGAKEATAISAKVKSRTRSRIVDLLEEISAKQKPRHGVIVTVATAIGSCLARCTTKHFFAAANQGSVHPHDDSQKLHLLPQLLLGALRTPDHSGTKAGNAQRTETASASACASCDNIA